MRDEIRNENGFTLIEAFVVIIIISIIAFISIEAYNFLKERSTQTYYASLEKTMALSGKNYFTENILARPISYDKGGIVFLNSFSNIGSGNVPYLVDNGYSTDVVDEDGNACKGYVLSYYNINNQYDYTACLKCNGKYVSNDSLCTYCDSNTTFDSNGNYYCTFKSSDLNPPSVNAVLDSGNDKGKAYSISSSVDWTKENITLNYKVDSINVKAILIKQGENNISKLSCNVYDKKCSIDVSKTLIGDYIAYSVDNQNRVSSSGTAFSLMVDKDKPTCSININNNNDTNGVDYTVNGFDEQSTVVLYNSQNNLVNPVYSNIKISSSYYAVDEALNRADCSINIRRISSCPTDYTDNGSECLKYSCNPSWTEWTDVAYSSLFVQLSPWNTYPNPYDATSYDSSTTVAYTYHYIDDYDTCYFNGGFTNPCYERITFSRSYLCPQGTSKINNKCYNVTDKVIKYVGIVKD